MSVRFSLLSFSIRIVHILDDQVRCAEVYETSARVNILEEWREQSDEFFFTVIVEDQVLLVFDNRVPLIELLFSILSRHVLFKFSKVAARDVDHVVLVHSGLICGLLIASTLRHLTRCLLALGVIIAVLLGTFR